MNAATAPGHAPAPVMTGRNANPHTSHDYAGISTWRFNMLAEIASYADCERAMTDLGDGLGFAKIGPRMTLIHEGHDLDADQSARTYAIELYSTKIIRYYPDGTFSVSNGGFNTPTTTERLTAVLPDGFRAYHHSTKWVKGGLGLAGVRNRLRQAHEDSACRRALAAESRRADRPGYRRDRRGEPLMSTATSCATRTGASSPSTKPR